MLKCQSALCTFVVEWAALLLLAAVPVLLVALPTPTGYDIVLLAAFCECLLRSPLKPPRGKTALLEALLCAGRPRPFAFNSSKCKT